MASCGFRNSRVAAAAVTALPWAPCPVEPLCPVEPPWPCPPEPVFNKSRILRPDEAPLWADTKPVRKTKTNKRRKRFFI
jgi:hypothetical protein